MWTVLSTFGEKYEQLPSVPILQKAQQSWELSASDNETCQNNNFVAMNKFSSDILFVEIIYPSSVDTISTLANIATCIEIKQHSCNFGCFLHHWYFSVNMSTTEFGNSCLNSMAFIPDVIRKWWNKSSNPESTVLSRIWLLFVGMWRSLLVAQ